MYREKSCLLEKVEKKLAKMQHVCMYPGKFICSLGWVMA
jgi:hypothetical protein